MSKSGLRLFTTDLAGLRAFDMSKNFAFRNIVAKYKVWKNVEKWVCEDIGGRGP